jgi:ABC-type glycerol-3-phosphate transport system substrate-binding protein
LTEDKVSRRGYLKYAGAGVVVVAGAAAGAYYATRPTGPTQTQTTESPTVTKQEVVLRTMVESVPDSIFIKSLLPEYEAKTGVKIIYEEYSYEVMHEKLVPQLSSDTGVYDFVTADYYWVGEFCQLGWTRPLDDWIQRDGFPIDQYIPKIMEVTGRYGYKVPEAVYYIPHWTYPMGFVYRKDLLEDATEKSNFKAKYGYELAAPETWEQYRDVVEFFYRPPNMYGSVMTGLRPDPVTMEYFNWLFGHGGRLFYDDFHSAADNDVGRLAVSDMMKGFKFAPEGATAWGFDESASTFAAGLAATHITWLFLWNNYYENPDSSKVVGKCWMGGVPGSNLPNWGSGSLGSWGWFIPKSSPHPEEAWNFLKWLESPDIIRRRALMGRSPTTTWELEDPELQAKNPWYEPYKVLVEKGVNFCDPLPMLPEGPKLVEVTGRYLSEAAVGGITPDQATKSIAKDMDELMAQSGYF